MHVLSQVNVILILQPAKFLKPPMQPVNQPWYLNFYSKLFEPYIREKDTFRRLAVPAKHRLRLFRLLGDVCICFLVAFCNYVFDCLFTVNLLCMQAGLVKSL